nr:uncharacterized protein LOC111844786 [Paramormyrops kingsleyae]
MDSRDMNTQDTLEGQNPHVEEFEHKLSVGSEKLHVHLMQELSRLQEKLSSYTGRSRLGPGHFQTCLATHTHHLQTIFGSNVRELCSRLHHYVGRLEESSGPAACQESMRWVVLTLDQGIQELQLHLDSFDAQVSKATGKLGDANKSERWRDAAAKLGRGVGEAAKALRATATKLPSGALGEQLSQGVTQFCHRSMAYIEHFDTWVKRQTEGPETQWVREHPLHGRLSTLSGDFSATLNALLTDIWQTLN